MPRDGRLLAVLFIGLLVIASVALVFADRERSGFPISSSSPMDSSGSFAQSGVSPPSPNEVVRDVLHWPFSRDSIWNLPIGSQAVYVHAGIRGATAKAMFVDANILVLKPTAPMTTVYTNYDDWGAGTRCSAQGPALFTLPIPSNFVIPGNHQGSPDGDTPNAAAAILAADGHTIIQTQPFARCVAGGPVTSHYRYPSGYDEDLYGLGNGGAHGGSGLSSIGGTVRLGELVPGGAVRHTLKLNMDSANFYGGLINGNYGYRWPAVKADRGPVGGVVPGYGGSIPQSTMGSLLALRPDFNVAALESGPGKILAQAFKDYGGYIVDSAGWSVYGIATETSPDGSVRDEFQQQWGFSLDVAVGANGWARDLERMFTALHVVDNWDAALWQTVSASNGLQGAGSGAPRVAWAPDFGSPPAPTPDTVPPVSTISPSGTSGANGWYASPVQVTLSASDSSSGVASIYVRTDGGAWQVYSSPVTVAGDGRHAVEYYATDVAGNSEAVRAVELPIDRTAPTTTLGLSGPLAGDGSYVSSVQVTLTATDSTSDINRIEYRIDGGAWRPYTAVFQVSGNGAHTLDYGATDWAGNAESTKTSVVQITGSQGSPPVSTANVAGTLGMNGWYVSNADVTLSATSSSGTAISIAYSLDGAAWTMYAQGFTISEGIHTLAWQAFDAAGYFEPMRSTTIPVDLESPLVGLASPSRHVTSAPITISWTGFDAASGIARYEVSLDGAPFESFELSTSFTRRLSNGNHRIEVKAIDHAGHENVSESTFSVESPAVVYPSPLQAIPLFFPATALGALLVTYLLFRRRHRRGVRRQLAELEQSDSWRGDNDPDESWTR